MEANNQWSMINKASNVIGVLQLIQNCMTQRQMWQKPVHSLMDAEAQVYAFRHHALADNECYDKFKDLVSNAECLGSNIGVHTARVNAILTDIATVADAPTPEERTHAKTNTLEAQIPTPHPSMLPTITSSTTMPAEMPTLTSMREEWLFTLKTMTMIQDMDVVDMVAVAVTAAITVGVEEALVMERATR
jgi:hypothetical protein